MSLFLLHLFHGWRPLATRLTSLFTRPNPSRRTIHSGGPLLEPGVLGRMKGVALLASHGFDGAIQRKAERAAAWLAGHRHAGDGSGVLASGDAEQGSATASGSWRTLMRVRHCARNRPCICSNTPVSNRCENAL